MTLLVAIATSALISILGWAVKALTRFGALTATLVGTVILWRTGWPGMAALGAFFIGSSLISRIAPDRSVTHFDAKGSTRDSWQVLANGGAAALACIVPLSPNLSLSGWSRQVWRPRPRIPGLPPRVDGVRTNPDTYSPSRECLRAPVEASP